MILDMRGHRWSGVIDGQALRASVPAADPIVVAEQQAGTESIPLMEPSAWPDYIES
jgi:hypothetical protein